MKPGATAKERVGLSGREKASRNVLAGIDQIVASAKGRQIDCRNLTA